MDFSSSPRPVEVEESSVDPARRNAVPEDAHETDDAPGDLADRPITSADPESDVTVDTRLSSRSRGRSTRGRPQDTQRQGGQGDRRARAAGSAAPLHGAPDKHGTHPLLYVLPKPIGACFVRGPGAPLPVASQTVGG